MLNVFLDRVRVVVSKILKICYPCRNVYCGVFVHPSNRLVLAEVF